MASREILQISVKREIIFEYNNSHPFKYGGLSSVYPLQPGRTRPIFSNSEKGRIQLNPLCGNGKERPWVGVVYYNFYNR